MVWNDSFAHCEDVQQPSTVVSQGEYWCYTSVFHGFNRGWLIHTEQKSSSRHSEKIQSAIAIMLVELLCCLESCYPLPRKGVAGERWGAMKWEMQAALIFNAMQSFWCNFFSEWVALRCMKGNTGFEGISRKIYWSVLKLIWFIRAAY